MSTEISNNLAAEEQNTQKEVESVVSVGSEVKAEEERVIVDTLQQQPQEPQSSTEKHPLQHEWTLHYDLQTRRPTEGNWNSNLKKVYTFGTVEDFWGVFNNIYKPSEMNVGSTYYLFKKDIRPEWEDENNKNGGKWQFTFRIQQKDLFDKSWLNTVMACIGETLEYSEDVCGVVASVKKNEYRMAIWTKTCENEEMCLSIGKQLKEAMENRVDDLKYFSHNVLPGRESQSDKKPNLLYSV